MDAEMKNKLRQIGVPHPNLTPYLSIIDLPSVEGRWAISGSYWGVSRKRPYIYAERLQKAGYRYVYPLCYRTRESAEIFNWVIIFQFPKES